MSELDTVRNLAKQVLTVPTLTGELDNSLWDRVRRLVRNAEYICRLPELAKPELQIDRFCLYAATYFSDAGLARYLDHGKTSDKLSVPDANSSDLLDFCTAVVEEKLQPCIDPARIEKINRIITEASNRFTTMTEAMILSDARNLDDMGAAGIFMQFKRFVSDGKAVSDALKGWKRKIDYRYWQARLKESFRFESVRKVASRRLIAAEHFMNQLKVEAEAGDLEELAIELLEGKQKVPADQIRQ